MYWSGCNISIGILLLWNFSVTIGGSVRMENESSLLCRTSIMQRLLQACCQNGMSNYKSVTSTVRVMQCCYEVVERSYIDSNLDPCMKGVCRPKLTSLLWKLEVAVMMNTPCKIKTCLLPTCCTLAYQIHVMPFVALYYITTVLLLQFLCSKIVHKKT